MYWLVLLIVSLLMAWVLRALTKNQQVPGGYWNIFVGSLIGAWLGDLILGNWWLVAGYNLVAGIIGSLVIGWLYIKLISKKKGVEKTDTPE